MAACVEPPQLALVCQYCPAGSLYQLLHGPRPSSANEARGRAPPPLGPAGGGAVVGAAAASALSAAAAVGGSGGGWPPLAQMLQICLGVAQVGKKGPSRPKRSVASGRTGAGGAQDPAWLGRLRLAPVRRAGGRMQLEGAFSWGAHAAGGRVLTRAGVLID
jgi:hypothetical protein